MPIVSTTRVPVGPRTLFASVAGEYHNPMRIVCPSCAAVFDVPKMRLTPGQEVRCARCGTDWTPLEDPSPPADAAVAEPFQPPEPPHAAVPPELTRPELSGAGAASSMVADRAVFDEPASAQLYSGLSRLRRSARARFNLVTPAEAAVAAGWAASIALVAGMAWASVAWRGDVMHAWPPSERIYAALGLSADR